MPVTGIQLMWWIVSVFFVILILGLLLHMIKGWFDSLEKMFLALKIEFEKMSGLISKLFDRSETDRLEIKDCQRHCAETYATKTSVENITEKISQLERRHRTVDQDRQSKNN